MKEHVANCNNVAHECVFNSFWTALEIQGTDKQAVPCYTDNTCEWNQYIVGLGLVDDKINVEYHQSTVFTLQEDLSTLKTQ